MLYTRAFLGGVRGNLSRKLRGSAMPPISSVSATVLRANLRCMAVNVVRPMVLVQPKILKTIVKNLTVLMMHHFNMTQATAKMLGYHQTMFKNVSILAGHRSELGRAAYHTIPLLRFNVRTSTPIGIRRAALMLRHPRSMARLRAERRFVEHRTMTGHGFPASLARSSLFHAGIIAQDFPCVNAKDAASPRIRLRDIVTDSKASRMPSNPSLSSKPPTQAVQLTASPRPGRER